MVFCFGGAFGLQYFDCTQLFFGLDYRFQFCLPERFFKKFGDDIDNYSASIAAQKVEVPTLVIHDSDDKEVPVNCAYNIRTKLKKGELLITNGLGHTRILKDATVVNRILDFIHR